MDYNKKKPVNKKLWIGIASVAIVALLIFMTVGYPAIKKNKTIKQADSLIAMEKYEEGISIYEGLLNEKYSDEIMDKRHAAIELMESEENLEKGLEASADDEISKAIKYLSKVPKADKKRYEKASEELKDIEKTIITEMDKLIANGKLEEAEKLADEFLKASPKNINIQNAKDEIQAKHIEAKKQAETEEQERKQKEEEAKKIEEEKNIKAEEQRKKDAASAAAAKKSAEDAAAKAKKEETNKNKKDDTQNTANNLIGSYKSIVSEQANLREAPTLKSKVVVTLKRGTTVYIYDTQVESADRIWCLVETEEYSGSGWVSYNTMNYTMQ